MAMTVLFSTKGEMSFDVIQCVPSALSSYLVVTYSHFNNIKRFWTSVISICSSLAIEMFQEFNRYLSRKAENQNKTKITLKTTVSDLSIS